MSIAIILIIIMTALNVGGAYKKGYQSTSDILLVLIGSLVCCPIAMYSVLVRVDKTLCTKAEFDAAQDKLRGMIRFEIKKASKQQGVGGE